MTKHSRSTWIPVTNFQEAEMRLSQWGRYMRRQVYESHKTRCILPKLIMYGQHIKTGYYDYPETEDQHILQTHRIFVFMPQQMQSVAFLNYVLGGHKAFKASRIGIRVLEFNRVLGDVREFYDQNKNINFL